MDAWALLLNSLLTSSSNLSSAVWKFDGPALPLLSLAGGLNKLLESVGILSLFSLKNDLKNDLESVGKSALLIGSGDSGSHLLLLARGASVVARTAAAGASTPEAGATPRCRKFSIT